MAGWPASALESADGGRHHAALASTGDKAAAHRRRDARVSVAQRGVAGSTFDHVAREAGVSRGLLHYYFGTKERLLAEVVRRDCDLRMALLERAARRRARPPTTSSTLLVVSLEEIVRDDPDFVTLVFELFTLSRRNEEIAAEFAELLAPHARARRRAARRQAGRGRPAPARRARGGRRRPLLARPTASRCACSPSPTATSRETIRAGVVAVRALLDDR